MAVAYESVATVDWNNIASTANMTIDKPTGLAVGDIMVAHISSLDTTNVAVGFNSTWTSIAGLASGVNVNSDAYVNVFWKIADSGDVAAGSFSFAHGISDSTNVCAGAIYRISGAYSAAAASAFTTDDGTPTFTNTITPTLANSVLLFLTTVADASQTAGTTSAYAITTSNPSWTEAYDFHTSSGTVRGLMAGAYASRPQVTATGDSTCTYSADTQNSIGVMVVMSPVTNGSVTAEPLIGAVTIPAPAFSASGGTTAVQLNATLSIPAPAITVDTPDWSNANKSSAPTWTNPNKN